MHDLARKLHARLLLAPRADDRLALDDVTLRAALDGRRALTRAERHALLASPLTRRRLRTLALARRPAWHISHGVLRAADSGAAARFTTEDGWWTLHLAGDALVLQLDADAPFAPALLRQRLPVTVSDGAGTVLLSGVLDTDGECEAGWPHPLPLALHLSRHGAAFSVRVSAPE